MSVLKNTMLALALALASAACMAQESMQWTRTEYIQKCEESAYRFKTPVKEAQSVCNCAAQYVSFVATGGKTERAEYTVTLPNELVLDSIRYCRAAYISNPDAFVEKFGTLSVSNGENQEGR